LLPMPSNPCGILQYYPGERQISVFSPLKFDFLTREASTWGGQVDSSTGKIRANTKMVDKERLERIFRSWKFCIQKTSSGNGIATISPWWLSEHWVDREKAEIFNCYRGLLLMIAAILPLRAQHRRSQWDEVGAVEQLLASHCAKIELTNTQPHWRPHIKQPSPK
jgi:hypothetical protein